MKKVSRLRTIGWRFIFLVPFVGIVIYALSPVHRVDNGNLEISDGILIRQPVRFVYQYMGNSANAAAWSSFVHHIRLLGGVDGSVHCKRRCFKHEDEKGLQWDEEIIRVDSLNKRRLRIYNARGFPMYVTGLETEQRYHMKGDVCSLSLVLILPKGASLWSKIKFYIGGYKVKSIFRANLKNIKRRVE